VDRFPVPINGRIVGFAIAVLVEAIALRVAWEVVRPIVPSLVSLLALGVVYHVIFRGGRH
jgi:hypothetical protein